jgi:hypothetical protein
MRKPNHQDAFLYLELRKYQHETGYSETEAYMLSDDFPLNFDEFLQERSEGKLDEKHIHAYVYMLEMLGAFYANGLIHENLLFRLQSFQLEWERFKDIIHAYREKNQTPQFMQGLEELAKAEKEYHNKD